MKQGQKLWNKEELILAVNLYCKLPFGKLHSRNPKVVHLANLIGRTPNSVAYKLVNFASLDPSLQSRGIKGAFNVSKLDQVIWNDFYNDWNSLAYESEVLLAKYNNMSVEQLNNLDEYSLNKEGKTREQVIKTRVNQEFFRKTILAAYNNTCCITGIQQSNLLIASHIRPWSMDEKNRLNPRNGLALNALHDKAFDKGFLTISTEYTIKISSLLLNDKHESSVLFFHKYHNKKILLPSRFLPEIDFLNYHNTERFIT